MIVDIFDRITGAERPALLSQQEFHSLDELYGAYEAAGGPALLIVEPESLPEVLTWLDLDDDVCLTSDPESLVAHRLQALALPDRTQFDAGTGLLNRPAFNEAMAEALQDESLSQLGLLICQLDQLRQLNEQLGREQADAILATLADLLRAETAEVDLLCRFSGKEFGILCDRDATSIRDLAVRIQRAVAQQFANGPEVTVSIGTASAPRQDAADIVIWADEALREAEAEGRNCVIHYADLLGSGTPRTGSPRFSPAVQDTASDIDDLTQLYNRRYLDRRLAREVQNSDVPLCVAFADVDRFRDINRQFGWLTGDQVLKTVGELIRDQLRECDWVGRYGGEEFCIVMQDTTLPQSFPILERLRQAVETHAFLSSHGYPFSATISIGAVESTSEEGHEQLLARAGQRAHEAKYEGRNRVLI